MKCLALAVIAIIITSHVSAGSDDDDADWKVSYYNGLSLGYEYTERMPKTYRKAKKRGWVLAQPLKQGEHYNCRNGGYFLGVRMIPNSYYPGAAVLYGMDGSFCGFQMLFPNEDMTQADRDRFAKEPAYQKTKLWIDGAYHDYYQITVYTRKLETICDPDYETRDNYMTGTIDGITIQRGLTYRPKHLLEVPQVMNIGEVEDEDWTTLNCYDGMGYFSGFYLEAWNETDCDRGFPCLGLYDPTTNYLAGMAIFPLLSANETWPNSAMVDHLDTEEVKWVTQGPDCLKDRTIPAMFFYATETPAHTLLCPEDDGDEYYAASDGADAQDDE